MKLLYLFIFILALTILSSNPVSAQIVTVSTKAETGDTRYAVIDNRTLREGGFWTKAELKTMKHSTGGQLKRHLNDEAWSTSSTPPATGANSANSANINIKVSRRFAISPKVIGSNGATTGTTVTSMTWYDASGYPKVGDGTTTTAESFENSVDGACKKYGGVRLGEKGKWRLPSIMELNLIYALSRYNLKKGIAPIVGDVDFDSFGSGYYWSATESIASSARFMDFSNGGVNNFNKSTSISWVRCIRDL